MTSWDEEKEEKRLYEESRALKFKAREMRKKRLEEERKLADVISINKKADEKREAERKQKEAKVDLDNRIRKAMIACANAFKANGLAFACSPVYGKAEHSFYILDVNKTNGYNPTGVAHLRTINTAIDNKYISIRTVSGRGFEWD